MLQYPTRVRYVGDDGVHCGVAILSSDILRSSTHLDEILEQNLHPRIDRRTKRLRQLLDQLTTVCGHGGAERVCDFQDAIKQRFDPTHKGSMKLCWRVAFCDAAQLQNTLVSC